MSLPDSSTERKQRTAELIALAHAADGDRREELLDEVIVLNVPVAHSLAARYRNRGQPIEELEQVACLALTKSVHAFRPERGEDLLVYAVPSILGELKRYFRDTSWAVRPPRRVQELRPRIVAAEADLTQELGREPDVDEISTAVGCSTADAAEARECVSCGHPESLDEPFKGDDSGLPRSDRLPTPEPAFQSAEALAILAPACRRLHARDRNILYLRFFDDLSQQQIAERLGITQVQVSRLLQRIFADLRAMVAGTSVDAA